LDEDARRYLFTTYLGFPYMDVPTFPDMTWRELGEFNEIVVYRISPQDARLVNGLCDFPLSGVGLEHFAAFIPRGYRENDYLLGRLHALDRLIDIVCNAAGVDIDAEPEFAALKRRGLLQILASEAPHLPRSAELIARLQRLILENSTPAGTTPGAAP
jgi:hypothetical protein